METMHAHFDCFGGATEGAMLAACLHAAEGWLLNAIQTSIQKGLSESKFESFHVSRTDAASISATVVNVILEDASADAKFTLKKIRCMLATAQPIPELVCRQVEMVFTEILKAENVVLGRLLTEEQGVFSVVSVVEVVATLLAVHLLHVETVSCCPLPLGEGSMWSKDKGLLPVPSPVTLQLLIGMPTCPGQSVMSDIELVSPAAAALLRVLTNVSSVIGPTQRPACFTTRSIGVGVDGEGNESRVLRLLLGEPTKRTDSLGDDACASVPRGIAGGPTTRKPDSPTACSQSDQLWQTDQLTQLEANLDDMTAESLAFAVQLLLDNGALDAWVVPIVMKKGRAAHTLCCLCRSEDTNILLQSIFRHTTTLGIRIHNMKRASLRRSFLSVQTPFSEDPVQVKVGYLGKEIVSAKAEHDDCARISRESNVPINQVADSAIQQAHTQLCKNLHTDSTISD